MKYILLLEEFIKQVPVVLEEFSKLPDLPLALDLPQVMSNNFSFKIVDDKIVSNEISPNTLYDYAITDECEFLIGSQHYKMTNKSKKIKCSGELKIDDDGKISFINNESGHYKPSKDLLKEVADIFKELNLLSEQAQIDYLY